MAMRKSAATERDSNPRTPKHSRSGGVSCAQAPSTTRPPAATAIALAFLLAACQTPAVKDRIVEVDKPVAVQPIKPADVPKVPAPLGPRPQSVSAAADTLLAKVCELEAYALKADPLLRVSAGLPQQPLPAFKECEP